MYANNPGGLTSVTVGHPYGACQAVSFVEFSATATTGTYDTTAVRTNAYATPVTSMSGSTGALAQPGELVIWATGQYTNPESYVPGSNMAPAASNGTPNGTGVSSEIEFATAPSKSSFTASSSWSAAAGAVATITTIPVSWPGRPTCADGIDNDSDGQTDYPSDLGCDSTNDTTETGELPPPCPETQPGVVVCLTPTAEVGRYSIPSVSVTQTGPQHHVAGYIDIYDFTVNDVTVNDVTVSLPCIQLVADAVGSNACAQAGGTFASRVTPLLDENATQPEVSTGDPIATVRVCSARLAVTVLGIGVKSAPAYTLC
jgi:hypothetical protein